MILSNSVIQKAIKAGHIIIDPPPEVPQDGSVDNPFNPTSLDLRLNNTFSKPKANRPYTFDIRKGNMASFMADNYEQKTIDEGGYALDPNTFIISNTKEYIELPCTDSSKPIYGARIEGRSSLARCGLLVHFTAPTIHAGFKGTITLEILNLGANPITLFPDMYICQLIFERVEGEIYEAPSQFQGQTTPEGL